MYEFGYDMDPGIAPDFSGVSPETWSNISAQEVVDGLRARVPAERQHELRPNISLRRLASLAGAPSLSPETRARLEARTPELVSLLDKIDPK